MLFTADEWPGGKNLAASPAIWRRMFAEIPSANFGLNYDPSHMVWQQMDYIAPIGEFSSRIFRVHLKDVAVDRQRLDEVGILAYPLEFHTPKLPGRGDVDWAQFSAAHSRRRGMTDQFAWKWKSGSLKGVWRSGKRRSLSALNICGRCLGLMPVEETAVILRTFRGNVFQQSVAVALEPSVHDPAAVDVEGLAGHGVA